MNIKGIFKSPRQLPSAVVDLDALIAEPVAFNFKGKIHQIAPVTVKEFILITSHLAKLDQLARADEVGLEEAKDIYYELFCGVVPTLKRADVDGMTQAQVGALTQLIIETVQGRAQSKKKV